ncbi:MAG TPA: CHASE domain-containing protein, partial [Gallionella sp.]
MADSASTDTRQQAWHRFAKALPWLVLLASLLITLQLWNETRNDARRDLQAIFDAKVREVVRDLEQRMKVYQQVLRGAQGLFSASNAVERDEFRIYVEQQQLERNYPGIQGLGYARIISPAQRGPHAGGRLSAPVAFIEPHSALNRQFLDFDMYADTTDPRADGSRRAAMERARDTGEAAISGKLRPIPKDGNAQAGFLMYLPVYRMNAPLGTVAERRAAISGWVYAPFRADDLMHGLLEEHAESLDFEIFDGRDTTKESLMHDSDNDFGSRLHAGFQHIEHLEIAGHPWTIAIRSHPGFESLEAHHRTRLVAAVGIGASLLLSLLTWLLVRDREQALLAVRRMNKDLIRSEASLHAMLDNLPHLTWLKDVKGRFVAVNQSFLKTTGKQHVQEVLGKTDFDLWPRELADKYRTDDVLVMKKRQALSVTEHSIMEGGRMAWVDTYKTPIIGKNGRLLGTVGIAHDITERLRIQREIERISLLYKMLSEINSANIHIRQRTQLFETTCRIVVGSGLFRMAWVGLLDRSTGIVVPVAQAGDVDGYLDKLKIDIHDPELGQGPVGMAIKIGAHVASNDIAHDPRMAPWREAALKHGFRASVTFPLTQTGEIIGALSMYAAESGAISDDVMQLLGSLAEDISFTLDFIAESQQREQAQNELRELSVFLQSALENERKRIARELHDELGQTMTALHFDLKWLHEHIDKGEQALQNRLHSMQELLGRTVDTVRRISEDLRPGMLDDLGLTAAIEHHAAKFSAQTGIACDLAMSHADYDLDEPVATALFRIVQESLTKVARHSGASRVSLRLQALADNMLLVIQDDGRGLSAESSPGRKTYGLMGMRERVKMLDGTLD